jgi:L-phenylalanine/L-methionine N-acetyltransferase
MTSLLHPRPASPLELRSTKPAVRLAEPGDIAELHRLYHQPHIVHNTGAPVHARLAQTAAWAEDAAAHGYLLVAALGDRLAGALALKTFDDPLRRHVAEIERVGVDQAWQGRGIGTLLIAAALDLADNWLSVLRVELIVRADNEAAVTLYRKFGFGEEGLLRAYAYRGGAYADCLAMARLRVRCSSPFKECSGE